MNSKYTLYDFPVDFPSTNSHLRLSDHSSMVVSMEKYQQTRDMMEGLGRAMPMVVMEMVRSAVDSWPMKMAMLITSIVFAQTSVVNLGFGLSAAQSSLRAVGLW